MSSLFQRSWLRVSWICVTLELRQNTLYFGRKVWKKTHLMVWVRGDPGGKICSSGCNLFLPALFHVPVTSCSGLSHFWRLCLHYPSTSPKPQQLATQPWHRSGKEGVGDTWGRFFLVPLLCGHLSTPLWPVTHGGCRWQWSLKEQAVGFRVWCPCTCFSCICVVGAEAEEVTSHQFLVLWQATASACLLNEYLVTLGFLCVFFRMGMFRGNSCVLIPMCSLYLTALGGLAWLALWALFC